MTREPWTVAYYATQDGQGGSSHFAVKCGERTLVRTTCQVASDEDESNIRLMAASQELFVQTVRFSECLEAMLRGKFDPARGSLEFFATEARAAIAKAIGSQRIRPYGVRIEVLQEPWQRRPKRRPSATRLRAKTP